MKKVLFVAFMAVVMVGCAERNNDGSFHAPKRSSGASLTYLNTTIVDSCEYIVSGYKMAHKGNCRFCTERRRKEYEELVKLIKED